MAEIILCAACVGAGIASFLITLFGDQKPKQKIAVYILLILFEFLAVFVLVQSIKKYKNETIRTQLHTTRDNNFPIYTSSDSTGSSDIYTFICNKRCKSN